ncbi:hypothetical protein SAMN05443428_11447 [Caloramator quimbayensis]|uniref:Probable membrane transporter protein n=1 Tax=Caloramator quimbayensis TaxID=1147123 RepID=A0A1T4XWN5_9CLOT|nr:sulfite exporter TauE/SafE family protein [Caloramator quimbayensis]SKA93618.1 hypothetical protein SAMN05443428_11447 [Caloramator quimbayensis]
MSITTVILFGLVVLITHFIEGITGFGCTVLALPFCTMLVGLKTAVPSLIIIALFMAIYVVVISYKDIVWKAYLKIIFFVLIGLPIGIHFFSILPENILKKILAVFMILVSIRGIYTSYKSIKLRELNPIILDLTLFLGGCIHGAFGSGGPLLVIYSARALKDKSNFRATLCMVWATLNSIIVYRYFSNNVLNSNIYRIVLYSLPFLILGAILGNIAHHKIQDKYFSKIVYAVLLISGIFMLI